MALPIVTDTAILRLKFYGGDTIVHDLLNVQWFQYHVGVSPFPGGLNIEDVARNAGQAWANFWKFFQSTTFTWEQTTMNWVAGFTGTGHSKFRTALQQQWTAAVGIAGTVAQPMLPNYCAYGVRKKSPRPGRGSNGQVRISGVPVTAVTGDELAGANVTALQGALDAMTPSPLSLNIATLGHSDYLTPGMIDGRVINGDPGHPPAFYFVPFEGVTLSAFVRTQITREAGRHRHHPPAP
jgi:hypothetical protein